MKKFIVFLLALGLVFGFAVSTAMADATLYGSARFVTFWHDKDKEYEGSTYDDEDLEWQMGKLSRFGVNFKQGDIAGKFELDARAGSGGASQNLENGDGSSGLGNMRLRHLYGEWSFGAGKLLVGQTASLYTFYISSFGNNAGAGLAQFGGYNIVAFRVSQIRLTFGNLKIAFLTPDTTDSAAGFADTDRDTTLPRIEIAYKLKLEPVTLDFMGGYQTYDLVDNTDKDESVDSYVMAIKASANFGAAYLNAIGTYRQNGHNYGLWTQNGTAEAAVYENGGIQDADAYSLGACIGFKVSDMITLEAAYVMNSADHDRAGEWEDDNQAYGVLCKITPAPGVTIQPEIMIDDKDDKVENGFTTEEGQDTRVGVFWKIDFK
jgi:hypothetical protein